MYAGLVFNIGDEIESVVFRTLYVYLDGFRNGAHVDSGPELWTVHNHVVEGNTDVRDIQRGLHVYVAMPKNIDIELILSEQDDMHMNLVREAQQARVLFCAISVEKMKFDEVAPGLAHIALEAGE
jgi:hypothetical protein